MKRERINAATQGPGVVSSGSQQVTSRQSLPMTGGNAPPSHCIIGNRRDRAASCDRPSPPPTTRPRRHSPSPCEGNIINTPAWLLPGILGRRQRSISSPAGTPVRPHQRLRFTFIEPTQTQSALVPRGDNPTVQGRSPRPSENVPTLSEIIANARVWSNRAEARGAGAQLVSGPQVVYGLGGRRCLPGTCQRAGRGTTRRRSPSRMEVEGGHIHISQGHGVAVILVSPEALVGVGGGVRSLPVPGEVEEAR